MTDILPPFGTLPNFGTGPKNFLNSSLKSKSLPDSGLIMGRMSAMYTEKKKSLLSSIDNILNGEITKW